jgi:hypothetical protein
MSCHECSLCCKCRSACYPNRYPILPTYAYPYIATQPDLLRLRKQEKTRPGFVPDR